MKWHCEGASEWLKGRTLVVGGSSVAATGQLTCELLANSLGLRRVASWCGAGLVPVVGTSDSGDLLSPCELYANADRPLCVLLARSPLAAHRASDFFDLVTNLAKDFGCSKVVVVTGSIASEKHDVQTSPFRYVADAAFEDREALQRLAWIDYESDSPGRVIHRGGFARKLLDACAERSLPAVVLFKYCYEGDNIPDAVETVVHLNKWLNFVDGSGQEDVVKNLKFPSSWRLVYGNRPPKSIY